MAVCVFSDLSSVVRNYYLEQALKAALIDYTTKEERCEYLYAFVHYYSIIVMVVN